MKTARQYGLTARRTKSDRTQLQHVSAPEELLCAKAAQLQAVITCLTGERLELFLLLDAEAQDSLTWIASDLANEVHLLAQIVSTSAMKKGIKQ